MTKAMIGLGTFYERARKNGYKDRPVNLTALDRELNGAQDYGHAASTSSLKLFPTYTLAQLATLPEPTWLVESVLPEHSLCMVYGASGSLKTFVVLGWALNGASQLVWADGGLTSLRGFKVTRRLRVVIIAGEGARGLRKRVRAWQKRHGFGDNNLEVIVIPEMPSFAKEDDIDRLIATINDKLGHTDLVIVDTVMRASSGLNLNIPADSQRFIDACERIKRELACTVVLVHHTGKDQERGHLGAENLKAAMDMMERVDLISRAPGRRVIRLRQEKAKDSDEREDIYLLATLEVVETAADGTDVTSLALGRCGKPTVVASSKDTPKFNTATQIIREHSDKGGIGTKALAEAMTRALNDEGMDEQTFNRKAEVMRKWISSEAKPGRKLSAYAFTRGTGEKAARVFRGTAPITAEDLVE
jgi:hypothetical protein